MNKNIVTRIINKLECITAGEGSSVFFSGVTLGISTAPRQAEFLTYI